VVVDLPSGLSDHSLAVMDVADTIVVPFNEFWVDLFGKSRQTPYPRAALENALSPSR